MSPSRESDGLAFKLEEGEKEALDAFCAKYHTYKKGAIYRLALKHFVRSHDMFWPDMGALEDAPFPLRTPANPTPQQPPTPVPPAPKTKRGARG